MKKSTEIELSLILIKLKEERLKTGMSQVDFGEKIGLSQNAYYKLETGKTKLDMYRFLAICKILDIEPKSFF
ncbi:helix-turn-helix transcriptional regulator [Tenacibaculum sp. HL-MS23]|uniref:helix-turn-helix domain-containing protein n=1 Tax=Tenacibaculum TaxID=104267 RepID=UPI001C4FF63F|nr:MULTISPECIES: helix-turn-helix transcriptional regulator [Tenacibaculum]QXP74113.1 helix-turn-helix transcriptional regulator [Tenacibaculum sp. AHE14PA]QXP75519.1 helix-turn-helix transcriptional regulator [Tenacibaculum sp. AHE15PA]WNW02072.1 helix-turn-helix transcriptional regulator [Tenacibaculum sp. HL-MS23]